MWFPLALTLGFALTFLAVYLEERRATAREASRRGASEPDEGAG